MTVDFQEKSLDFVLVLAALGNHNVFCWESLYQCVKYFHFLRNSITFIFTEHIVFISLCLFLKLVLLLSLLSL